jgi:hypothetical protein
MRKTNMCRNVSILLFGWGSFASVALAQGMRSQKIQIRNTGRGYAGTKQPQQTLANPGFHLRPPRHNRDVLRR